MPDRSILFVPPAGSTLLKPGPCGYRAPMVGRCTLTHCARYGQWVERDRLDEYGQCRNCCERTVKALPLLWHGQICKPGILALEDAAAFRGWMYDRLDYAELLKMAREAVVVLGGEAMEVPHA